MNLLELIQDDKGQLSSTRLGYLIGVLVLAFPIIMMTIYRDYANLGVVAGIFAGMAGGTAIMGKVSETSVQKAGMNPDPVPAAPPAILGPTTTINVAPDPQTVKKGKRT